VINDLRHNSTPHGNSDGKVPEPAEKAVTLSPLNGIRWWGMVKERLAPSAG
jgi:hypothetical protein